MGARLLPAAELPIPASIRFRGPDVATGRAELRHPEIRNWVFISRPLLSVVFHLAICFLGPELVRRRGLGPGWRVV